MDDCDKIPELFMDFGIAMGDFFQSKITREELIEKFMNLQKPIEECAVENKRMRISRQEIIDNMESRACMHGGSDEFEGPYCTQENRKQQGLIGEERNQAILKNNQLKMDKLHQF